MIDRITRDISTLEGESNSKYHGFKEYYWNSNEWYESFKNKQESLNIDDYKIWLDLTPGVRNYSSRGYDSSKQLIYYLDELRDILNVAEGYLIYLKLPFLYSIREKFIQELFPDSESVTEVIEKERETKLKWGSTNRVLYDLFAQLTLIDVKPGKRLINNSIKELARFLSEHIEGLPSVETVERELEKMRELEGIEKAKRGRIDLHIFRDSD